jgi:TonB family protein
VPIARVPIAQAAAGPAAATAASLAPEPEPAPGPAPRPAARPRLRSLPLETGPLAVEVRILWGDQALGDAMFERESQVTVGPGKTATFQVEASLVPEDTFALLRRDGEDWYLRYTERMDGEVRRKGETLRLSALGARGLARPGDDGAMELKLPADGAAWVDLGNLRAEIAFRARPKAAVVPLVEQLDFRFLNLLLIFAFLAGGAVVAFENFAFDTDLVADDLFSNQARYTRLILKPVEKKNPLLQRLRSLEGPKDPGELAAKHHGDEGQMGKKDAPHRNTRSAPRGDPNDKDLVKNQGLLAMLGRGQAGLSTIFGTGGLGGDLKGAIGGITGATVGDAHGFGGLGLKGTGTGGGGVGNTIGVGDIGTKGRGGGLGGYGTGVGGLGRKGSADVGIDSSEAVIMGSLDKELIRRVIQQHRSQIRYCYESELVRNPKLGGKVAVKFVITADGGVSSAVTAQSTLHDATVESCINARVKSWQFPKPKGGGIVVVTYPFLFKQSGE